MRSAEVVRLLERAQGEVAKLDRDQVADLELESATFAADAESELLGGAEMPRRHGLLRLD